MEPFVTDRRVLIPHAIGGVPLPRSALAATTQSLTGETMGTTWSVRCLAEARLLDSHRRAIEHLLDELVATLSNWEADSDLSRFNRSGVDRWHALPASLVEVLEVAKCVFERSGGAFDPGVGPAVARWGFGPSHDAALDDAGSSLARVELDVGGRRARKHGPVALDLCGIAKGYAVDRVSRLLVERGVPHHLVEIGGELRGHGVKADATPWWVGLERPPDTDDAETIIALHGLSIATSGDYRKRLLRDGVAYSHTIDPRTGGPVVNGVTSVTVITGDCVEADAHATAILVLGDDAGLAYARDHGLAAVVHLRDERERVVARTSPAYDALLA